MLFTRTCLARAAVFVSELVCVTPLTTWTPLSDVTHTAERHDA